MAMIRSQHGDGDDPDAGPERQRPQRSGIEERQRPHQRRVVGSRLGQHQAQRLARRHGLRGANSLEEARCDELLGCVDDVRLELRKIQAAPADQRAAIRDEILSTVLPRWLGDLERHLAPSLGATGFAVGGSITVADLALWYLLELIRDNDLGPALESCPALRAFAGRIAARPRIAGYLSSPRRPALTPMPR